MYSCIFCKFLKIKLQVDFRRTFNFDLASYTDTDDFDPTPLTDYKVKTKNDVSIQMYGFKL